MSKAIVNRQQADALAQLTRMHGRVIVEYDYGSRLIVSWTHVPRATIHSTGKVEIDRHAQERYDLARSAVRT